MLSLPHAAGARWISWLVFLGGFSAGTGMVMAEAMALATMVSNHLFVPAIGLWRPLERLRRHLLPIRWFAAALVIVSAFAYERAVGGQYELVSIGLISFAAVLVLAPSILGGLYWRGASKAGALAGLIAGFATWGYTLVVPVLARGGWLPERLLAGGPFGISALRPEALLGLGGLDRIPHAVFWILFVDVGAFVVGSVLFPAPAEEEARAERLIDAAGGDGAPARRGRDARGRGRRREASAHRSGSSAQYHDDAAAARLADHCLAKVGAGAGTKLSALQLAELEAEVEASLAGSIGTAAAHAALKRNDIVTPAEGRAISRAYGRILTALRVPPAELRRKIDYHRERERLLAHEASAQRFLADVSMHLAGSLDIDTTGRTVVRLAVPRLVDAALLLGRAEVRGGEAARLVRHVGRRAGEPRPSRASRRHSPPFRPTRASPRALESGRAVVNRVRAGDDLAGGAARRGVVLGRRHLPARRRRKDPRRAHAVPLRHEQVPGPGGRGARGGARAQVGDRAREREPVPQRRGRGAGAGRVPGGGLPRAQDPADAVVGEHPDAAAARGARPARQGAGEAPGTTRCAGRTDRSVGSWGSWTISSTSRASRRAG